MDKLTQLREMRERNAKAGRVRSLVNPRTLPSAEAIKAAADRAEARSKISSPHEASTEARQEAGRDGRKTQVVNSDGVGGSPAHKIINGLNDAVEGRAARVTTYAVDSKQGKTTKMSESAAGADWDKNLYQKLYLRVHRAKTPEARMEAEAALRKEFPNQRPRAKKKQAASTAKPSKVSKAVSRKKKKK